MDSLYEKHHSKWVRFIENKYPEFASQFTCELFEENMVIVLRSEWSGRRRCLEMLTASPKVPEKLSQLITLMLTIPKEEDDFECIDFDAPVCLRLILVCENFKWFKSLPIFHTSLIILNGILGFALLSRAIKAAQESLIEFACVWDKDEHVYTVRHVCRYGYPPRVLTEKIPKRILEESIEDRSIFRHLNSTFYWEMLRGRTQIAKRKGLL